MILSEFVAEWRDEPQAHYDMACRLAALVNEDVELRAHRDYIETNSYGFGERCMHWLWKMLVDEMPSGFRFLEIGVHRGQIVCLVPFLAKRKTPIPPFVVGVSKYTGDEYGEPRDYREDVKALCEFFRVPVPRMVKGDSTNVYIQGEVELLSREFDIVYIDGGHDEATVKSDIRNYGVMVKPGGYLVCDDAANNLNLPDTMWKGHQTVSDAVDALLPPKGIGPQWTHLGSISHNRLWRRV